MLGEQGKILLRRTLFDEITGEPIIASLWTDPIDSVIEQDKIDLKLILYEVESAIDQHFLVPLTKYISQEELREASSSDSKLKDIALRVIDEYSRIKRGGTGEGLVFTMMPPRQK